jgi:hypothetical protein
LGSGDTSQIDGYLIHSLCFKDSKTTSTFWQLQGTIVTQLQALRDLQVVVAFVLSDYDGRCVTSFVRNLHSNGWKLSKIEVLFWAQGDSIAGACHIIIGIHLSCSSTVEPFLLKEPPPTPPRPLGSFFWEPFNQAGYSMTFFLPPGCLIHCFHNGSHRRLAQHTHQVLPSSCRFG